MDRIIHFFLPKKPIFFKLLSEQSKTVLQTSGEFCTLLKNYNNTAKEKITEKIDKINGLENTGDTQTREIIEHLNQSLITPYDREDIHAITVTLDDMLDLIDQTARKLRLYKVSTIPQDLQKQALELHKMIQTTDTTIQNLHNLEELKTCCESIYASENKGDKLFENAITNLFDNSTEKDTVQLIKLKDLYENMEQVFDKAKNLADTIQIIVVKHG